MKKSFGKITIAIFLALIVGVFSFNQNIVQGEVNEQKVIPEQILKKILKRIDSDKNKLFDDLEDVIKDKADADKTSAIVVFNRQINEAELNSMKVKFGDFTPRFLYRTVPGFAAELTKKQIKNLKNDSRVKQIEYDAKVILHLDQARAWFGVDKAQSDFSLTGNTDGSSSYSKDDLVIAVVDTGIDVGHVDLDGGKVIGWYDPATGSSSAYDQGAACSYHGTHVSSIAAGEGEGNSAYMGVAPGAALVGVKVLRKIGSDCTESLSTVNAGIQWVIDNKNTYGIEIMNLSIGAAGCSDGSDSTSSLVNAAVAAGIATTVSAGNEGPGTCTIGSPAAAADAITVGAMADVGETGFYQADFSSRGPTADSRLKPDISSPGVQITASKGGGSGTAYQTFNGTSMASPFIAGVAALMLEANSALTPSQIKSTLMNMAVDWGPANADIDYGAGRLDAFEAIKSAGSFSGTNINTPEHQYFTDNLTGTSDEDWYDINVTDASYPIAITMIMSNWVSSNNPDFDMKLYAADGTTQLAVSQGITRQETIGYQPASTGLYKLRVYSYLGSGDYFFDLSAGTSPLVSISLTTDGLIDFGILGLGDAEDTTSSGLNDIETISVDTGPVNLDIKSTVFSDNGNSWSLNTTNSADQVKWEFSPDETSWTTFVIANTLYSLASSVSQGSTQEVSFRLTMPTSTSSNNTYSGQITIVATAP